jgi:hypothetical protein
MKIIAQSVFLYVPLIMAGIANMYFVRTPVLQFLNRPIDYRLILRDGRRLFGDNKTWKGFAGMILLTSLFTLILWLFFRCFPALNSFVLFPLQEYRNPAQVSFYGTLWGFGYVLFELPNSFLKRRFKISPGGGANGFKGAFFLFLDQFDSALGCGIAMLAFYRPSPMNFIIIVAAGAVVHYCVNIFLFIVKIKKRAG